MVVIDSSNLQQLFDVLHRQGYALIGPTVRDGAIIFDTLHSVDELPRGWEDVQTSSSYTLRRRDDDAFFGYGIGPVSWKKFLFPPRVTLFTAIRTGKGFDVQATTTPERNGQKFAFIGIRSCELRALELHDRVFTGGEFKDPTYAAMRAHTFLVAVNCQSAGGNCFCTSVGGSPKASSGFDLCMTELIGDGTHSFMVEAGSERGEAVLCAVTHRPATGAEADQYDALLAKAESTMGRQVELEGLKELIMENFDHPMWDEVAKRCLACANCTMVCPTCFCSTVNDTTDLGGHQAERTRRWDSCFTADFSRVAGGNIRPSTRARYRQWLSHKFSYWVEQFGSHGCVGCGRCITWCPAGIDLTEQLDTLRKTSYPAAIGEAR